RMRIQLSGTRRTVTGTDVMTAWFAKGVGLVKYVERQELSPLEDRGVITEITEELGFYENKSTNESLGRGETPAESLLADHSSDDELHQVVLASRLRPNPSDPVPAQGLTIDERPGNGPVQIQLSHVEPLARHLEMSRTARIDTTGQCILGRIGEA